MRPIATFHSPFSSKFGIPRQAGIVTGITGQIILAKEYRNADAIRGMEEFDYLWLIWGFSANKHKANGITVRPPRLGGNRQLGVFATRSPFRPNPIGLSSVRIDHIDYHSTEAPVIHVLGADLMDGTPIYDIKPYIPYTDAHPEARGGFTDTNEWHPLKVIVPKELKMLISAQLIQVLAQDPRPQYHNDPDRIYGMPFDGKDVRFKVQGHTLTVVDVAPLKQN
ncbi:MAG: tRNA (N6-threonylcarbamoyladenosine(37)-N6)-methyltransferase TrmO [Prevotellaceae bacterium]|nr:tRNA (N6-threonylcarbamoyladenosine(37)-N6)-methyltransferase TrmO [Prevotellaceae bacterium]MDO4931997.1 tRNA (N6-threonylcarbamoyladenosine(37)-N6)-methyltransferase TrmO [Prevotellaceae bacterium]